MRGQKSSCGFKEIGEDENGSGAAELRAERVGKKDRGGLETRSRSGSLQCWARLGSV